jgi:hypothetical protein
MNAEQFHNIKISKKKDIKHASKNLEDIYLYIYIYIYIYNPCTSVKESLCYNSLFSNYLLNYICLNISCICAMDIVISIDSINILEPITW